MGSCRMLRNNAGQVRSQLLQWLIICAKKFISFIKRIEMAKKKPFLEFIKISVTYFQDCCSSREVNKLERSISWKLEY